jgi:SagB-type dehydrogenase family enzyme
MRTAEEPLAYPGARPGTALTELGEDWLSIPLGSAARCYADLIFDRAASGMPIKKWPVDWDDAPWPQKFYPAAQFTSLPDVAQPGGLADTGRVELGRALWDLMFYAYGVVARRSRVNNNESTGMLINAEEIRWGRGASSGGGRYCAGVYVVIGQGLSLSSGIYHYSPIYHGLELLAGGDWTGAVAHAQGYGAAQSCYLVISLKYWQSAFKYNDFAAQATCMDLGTLMGTWRYLLGPSADMIQPDLWVNEPALAGILGIDSQAEAVAAVLGLGGVTASPVAARPAPAMPQADERSREVYTFVTQRALQRDALAERGVPADLSADFPVPQSLAWSVEIDADAAGRIASTLRRETSFGRFDGIPLPRRALLEALIESDTAQNVTAGTFSGAKDGAVSLFVLVKGVEGLAPGCYRYDRPSQDLERIGGQEAMAVIQRRYFLNNYDLGRAAAAVIFAGDVVAVAERYGVRGYRALNTAVGAVCQHLHLECARRGIGAGAALGVDAAAAADALKLGRKRPRPLLTMFLGHDRPNSGALDVPLAPEGSR